MSAGVLLYMYKLNELWKNNKMWGLLSILSLFRNGLNKFNNTATLNVRLYEWWSRNTRSAIYFLLIMQSLWYLRNLIFDLFWILEANFKTRGMHCFNWIVTLET